jgi:hypothetical protein
MMRRDHELGRTRLHTRRQRRRLYAAALLAVAGFTACLWLSTPIASAVAGNGLRFPDVLWRGPFRDSARHGGLLGIPVDGQPVSSANSGLRFPLAVTWPAPFAAVVIGAVPLWLGWMKFVVVPVIAAQRREVRLVGLARVPDIAARFGKNAVRRAGVFTLPGTSRVVRALLPTAAFGFPLGRPVEPRARLRLWANWESRIRIIAGPGWGKTFRLLVPIIRALPGAAFVSSTEPDIFATTVTARQFRRPPVRWEWLRLLVPAWRKAREYPVAVVDFSDAHVRFAAGYPAVVWNLINGCERFPVALRRATALVAGVESSAAGDRGRDGDRFFRDSADEVLAAWLHAAALGDREIDDILRWLYDGDLSTPRRILEDSHRADPTAVVNMTKHLDPRAGRTTSGVERFLILGLNSIASDDGRAVSGQRFGPDATRLPATDMEAFIRDGGTIYLLADQNRIDRARPLLSLFANEMFFLAEQIALTQPYRPKRLPQPFIGVIDELRYGVTVSSLPYVANALRKYGIGYVYGVQSAAQEVAVYGEQGAKELSKAAGVTIVGGVDNDIAKDVTARAGLTPVVTPTYGYERVSEQIQLQETFSVRDQQKLTDGEAVILAQGIVPFVTYTPGIYDSRRTRRRIDREADTVTTEITAAREAELAAQTLRHAAAARGADIRGTE